MHPEMERIQNCLAAVRRHTDFVPEVAVVLGSGLGGFADMVKQGILRKEGRIYTGWKEEAWASPDAVSACQEGEEGVE